MEALRELLKHGKVLIYTLRVNPYERHHDGDEGHRRTQTDIRLQLESIHAMLAAEGLHEVKVHMTLGKPAGTYYIDNQAIEFRGDWGEILDRVLKDPEAPEARGEKSRAPASGSLSIREFPSGATRDTTDGKPDFPGFLSPLVIKRYGKYMLSHQAQSDGTLRASGNWKKGIPMDAYLSSAWRHLLDWWLLQEGYEGRESLEDALCAIVFNASGALHELLKASTSEPA